MMSPAETQVFVVDDDAAVCKSMEWLFQSIGIIARSFTNPHDFLKVITPYTRGCLIVDIRMPEMSGLDVQNILNQKNIRIPIVFLTSHHDVHVAVKAMKSGALDFITKPFSEQQLLDIVHRAISLDQNQSQGHEDYLTIKARVENLSQREKQVLDLVTTGMLNKNISSELGICAKTVELHRSRVMKKMHAKSLAELVRMTIIYNQYVKEKIPA
jgi:FixJ family two-component response regulator